MAEPTTAAPGALPAASTADRTFCSTASLEAGESLAGTAPARRTWLLVEHPGPWGHEPLTDAPWPDGLGAALQQATAATGVRMLAVRRHDARPLDGPPAQPYVAMSVTGPGGWAVSRRLDSTAQLRTLPLADLAQGIRPAPGSGWVDAGPLWGVCVHGTRDACCARLGRGLADALVGLDPEHVWEISHSGGHRFAPVLLAWPEGLVYGRVPSERLGELVDARRRGHVVPELLRGRTHQDEPDQAGELAVRTHLGLTALDAVRPAAPPADPGADPGADARPDGDRPDGDQPVVPTWWQAEGRRWRVDVRRVALPDRPASCAKPAEPAWAWTCDDPVPLPTP